MNKALVTTLTLVALTSAAPAVADDARWLTDTMVNARAEFMAPGLNYLTFQHIDTMFATRPVKAGGAVWALPVEPGDIGDSFAFGDQTLSLDQFLEATSTNALLVIKDGAIVHESYRNGMTEQSRHISFSMAKSFLATMIGIAIDEGKIGSVEDKVIDYLPDWTGSAYANITIRDLLEMRSGIAWLEVYEFGSDTQLTEVHDNSLVAYNYRWCDYARDRSEKAGEPGSVFNYSTLDTSVLGCVLEAAIGMKGADYMSEKIWQPAGMEADAYYLLDGPDSIGREFYGAGYNATLRDYGRFGLMMLNGGMANGKQVVPQDWVKVSTAAAPDLDVVDPVDNLGYGYQWWTVPETTAYTAQGLFNQYIYVDPDTGTVIVKLASPASPLGWGVDNLAFFRAVVETVSQP
jgi:CubicO group peptidase (beta-lactamase class C family)